LAEAIDSVEARLGLSPPSEGDVSAVVPGLQGAAAVGPAVHPELQPAGEARTRPPSMASTAPASEPASRSEPFHLVDVDESIPHSSALSTNPAPWSEPDHGREARPSQQDLVHHSASALLEDDVCCPITMLLMADPVVTADGFSYEREAIVKWLQEHDISPKTGEPLPNKVLIPNHTLRAVIQGLTGARSARPSFGSERASKGLPSASTLPAPSLPLPAEPPAIGPAESAAASHHDPPPAAAGSDYLRPRARRGGRGGRGAGRGMELGP